jgi:hydrogenase expression/formation protein HypC
MCLAIPARIVALNGLEATVDLGGVRKAISIALVPEAQLEDYVIVHVGHAIGMVDPEEARLTLELFAELGASTASEGQA